MKARPWSPSIPVSGATLVALLVLTAGLVAPVRGQVPPNNDCSGAATSTAFILSEGASAGFSNAGATLSGVIPSCGSGAHDVWFLFTAARSSRFEINTEGSGLDTVLAVYDAAGYIPGSCNLLPELACNDDATSTVAHSAVQIDLLATDEVFIQVSAAATGLVGSIQLNINTIYELIVDQPPPAVGPLEINLRGGNPFSTYFTGISLAPGAFPDGWFFGIDILPGTILFEAGFGPPFMGNLDSMGTAAWNSIASVPPGIDIYAVSIVLDPSGIPVQVSDPIFYSTL